MKGTIADPPQPLWPIYPRWLLGSGCLQLKTSFRFGQGRGGVHQVDVEIHPDELARDAAALRADPSKTHHEYRDTIRRGRGQQVVPIRVPRALLLSIADALAGAADLDDAGHRFWHWENRDHPRPCSDCRESLDADDVRVDAARAAFLVRWARELESSPEQLEELLTEYRALPSRRPRR